MELINDRLKNAIDIWNDKSSKFASSYIMFLGHCRGCRPVFTREERNGFICSKWYNEPFQLDKFSLDYFKDSTDEENEIFIDIIEGELSMRDDLINKLSKRR